MKDAKFYDYVTKHKVRCKCGHKVFITKYDKIICSWCGNYVFKDKKKEFNYMIYEIDKLQSNWNSLKEYLEEMKLNKRYDNDVERFTAYDDALDKMNELEGKNKE